MIFWLNTFRLAWRELRHGFRGFGVFLLCLFLGVFAVAAINSFSEASRAGLQADARALLGGDIELRLTQRPVPGPQRAVLLEQGRFSEIAELRTMARSGKDTNLLVELKAVDRGYPLVGSIGTPDLPVSSALTKVDGVFGALVEPALLERMGLQLGDRLRVGQIEMEIRGRLTREPDRGFNGFTLGPRVLISQDALTATGLVIPGSLISYSYRIVLPAGTSPKATVETLNSRFPEAGWRARTFDNAAPRVKRALDRLADELTLVALCALLTGGLGVASAVRGYLAGRRTTLATFKCLGASSGLIFATCLVQLLLLATLGIGAGLVAGGAVPWVVSVLFGELLPTPLIPALYPRPLLLAASFGWLVVLTFSLVEVGRARHTPGALLFRGEVEPGQVKIDRLVWVGLLLTSAALIGLTLLTSEDRRIAGWFILGVLGCMGLFRLLALALMTLVRRLPRPTRPSLRLALSNLHRPGSSAPAAIFALGLGLTALVVVTQVEQNLVDQVSRTLPEEAPAFFAMGLQPNQLQPFIETIRAADPDARIDRNPSLRGRIVRIAGQKVSERKIPPEVQWAVRGDRFVSYSKALKPDDVLVAGKPWPDDYRGEPLISLTADLGKGFGVQIGDTLTVNILGRDVTGRIANLRQVDWSNMELNYAILFSPGLLEKAPQIYLASAYLDPAVDVRVTAELAEKFPNVSLVNVRQVLENVVQLMDRIGLAFRAIALVAVLSGLLVLAGTVAADRRRRLYEAVLFKVCGATRGTVMATYLQELLMIGVAAGLAALLLGSLSAWLMIDKLMKLDFLWSPWLAVATLAAGLIVPLTLGLVGTASALREKPMPYLRND